MELVTAEFGILFWIMMFLIIIVMPTIVLIDIIRSRFTLASESF